MEGTIIKWHKKIGDSVKRDEIFFEISSDKVDTEVPSRLKGYFLKYYILKILLFGRSSCC
jgi:2-oxoglutarate dehydrogenase E2 component (dihydrolipoamide succinyltransferase)